MFTVWSHLELVALSLKNVTALSILDMSAVLALLTRHTLALLGLDLLFMAVLWIYLAVALREVLPSQFPQLAVSTAQLSLMTLLALQVAMSTVLSLLALHFPAVSMVDLLAIVVLWMFTKLILVHTVILRAPYQHRRRNRDKTCSILHL